jgi:hypothetical protein
MQFLAGQLVTKPSAETTAETIAVATTGPTATTPSR